jgi:peptide/nickel transport system substrate-binding protein
MIGSRVRGGALRLTVATAGVLLVLSGCARVDSPKPEGGTGGADDRTVRAGGTLRYALDGEPGNLDPTLFNSLPGRIVYNAICEKLYDVNDKMEVVPQLAAAMPEVSADGLAAKVKLRTGLKFADGTTLDAAAVKTSLDRHRTLAGSLRKTELANVAEVTVVDPATVEFRLSTPYSPLAAMLSDRPGMIMSPAALAARGADFGTAPVCVGPFKFATHVAQDRVEVVKDPNYYDADKVKLDKVVFKIIPDANTRYNNLRSGEIEVMNNVSPINVDELKGLPGLHPIITDSLGYQGITFNTGNVNGVGKDPGTLAAPYAGPLASDSRVRRAFMLSVDREALSRTVFRGQYAPDCGPISAASPLSSPASQACPKHDPADARRLLGEAGVATPLKISLIIPNNPDGRRIGEAIKSMTAEGGFDVQLEPTEFASSLDIAAAGKFQAFQIGWSGRLDPDSNIAEFVQTHGPQNRGGYSNPEVDTWINEARATTSSDRRKELYGKIVTKIQQDAPLIYLWRQKNIIGVSDKVSQVRMYGDGIVRFGAAGFVE